MKPKYKIFPPLKIVKLPESVNDGLLKTVLVITGELPDKAKPDARQESEAILNDKYSATLAYFPSGFQQQNSASLLVSIRSDNNIGVYTKIETAAITNNVRRCFRYSMEDFTMLPHDFFWIIKNIGVIDAMLKKREHFVINSMFQFEVVIMIDMIRMPVFGPGPDVPLELVKSIKNKIYDPCFGDYKITVGGVNMYAHKEVMQRNRVLFHGIHCVLENKNSSGCEFPDIYPQIFESYLIGCYLRNDAHSITNVEHIKKFKKISQ